MNGWNDVPLYLAIIAIIGLVIKAFTSKPRKDCCERMKRHTEDIVKNREFIQSVRDIARNGEAKAAAARRRIDEKTGDYKKEVDAIKEIMDLSIQSFKDLMAQQIKYIDRKIDDKFNSLETMFRELKKDFKK